jgi:hypothetical protein
MTAVRRSAGYASLQKSSNRFGANRPTGAEHVRSRWKETSERWRGGCDGPSRRGGPGGQGLACRRCFGPRSSQPHLSPALSSDYFTRIRQAAVHEVYRAASPKGHDKAEDGTVFQGGGSGERSGPRPSGPSSKRTPGAGADACRVPVKPTGHRKSCTRCATRAPCLDQSR